MSRARTGWIAAIAVVVVTVWGAAGAQETATEPFEPRIGQPGKDVVWVPTPMVTVEKMLDMAGVTAEDFVIDLGSGDGRNVIAAAKRGARALGVEYNPDMVALSRQSAETEGVADRATFRQGDMFEADISQATVMALFLLPDNLRKLTPKFLDLRPGTRIVANTFGIEGWSPDEEDRVEGACDSWCATLLYIVPAKVAGDWQLGDAVVTLSQEFQIVSGWLMSDATSMPVAEGRLRGVEIVFRVGETTYAGRVDGDSMSGTAQTAGRETAWTARRR